jgi:hypothetical protein
MFGKSGRIRPRVRPEDLPISTMEPFGLFDRCSGRHRPAASRLHVQSQRSAFVTRSKATSSNQQIPTVKISRNVAPGMHAYACQRHGSVFLHYIRLWNPRCAAVRGKFSRESLFNS